MLSMLSFRGAYLEKLETKKEKGYFRKCNFEKKFLCSAWVNSLNINSLFIEVNKCFFLEFLYLFY